MAVECDNCGKKLHFSPVLGIYTPEKSFTLCSYSCMSELGWKLRDSQPKLSKSRVDNP